MPFPKPAPSFFLVEVPPGRDTGWIDDEVSNADGRMLRVDQHKLLVQLLVRRRPCAR